MIFEHHGEEAGKGHLDLNISYLVFYYFFHYFNILQGEIIQT